MELLWNPLFIFLSYNYFININFNNNSNWISYYSIYNYSILSFFFSTFLYLLRNDTKTRLWYEFYNINKFNYWCKFLVGFWFFLFFFFLENYKKLKKKNEFIANSLKYLKFGEISIWILLIFLFMYLTYKRTGKICFDSSNWKLLFK